MLKYLSFIPLSLDLIIMMIHTSMELFNEVLIKQFQLKY